MNNSLRSLLSQKRRSAFLITSLAVIFSFQTVYSTSAQDLLNNENLTQYENSYLGIKFSYPPRTYSHQPTSEPSGLKEGCILDSSGCSLHVFLKFGSLDIEANSIDNSHFSEGCNCDTLEEYRNYYYEELKHVSKISKQFGYGLGNYTWINDNQTTIGKNYPSQQYEVISPGKMADEPSACDHTIRKHYGILTKVDKIFYRIEHDSCAKPEVYAEFFPEVKKIFDSIEFLPAREIGSTVTSDNSDNLFPDQSNGSNSLQILSHNSFTDTLGFLHVVGEVKNDSPSHLEFVEIVGTFYDSNNQVVGTKFTYTNPSDIGPGDTAPFELILTSASIPILEIDDYKLVASYQ